ncbi:MAG: SixA phosphatase family protein [Hyphomicrobiaceae bacterium]
MTAEKKIKRTLLLLRHAKSSLGNLDLDDHERPLSPRGAKAASKMGAHLNSRGLAPTIVLCSDAVRTRATCALVVSELATPPAHVETLGQLYLAPPMNLLDAVHDIDDVHTTALIIAHNPGLHAVALTLTGQGGKTEIKEMSVKFPTAALAVLSFAAESWQDIAPARGVLEEFRVPRDLK